MRWAKEHDCWFYNFLGIPTVLEEAEGKKDPLWGVYTFKRGFNGFARCSLPGYDLPYNPVIYGVYKRMLEFKHWREERRSEKEHEQQAQAEQAQKESHSQKHEGNAQEKLEAQPAKA
jgi:hypothetical protein